MITVVTTHNFKIFKLFYTHKHHQFLNKRLFLYVDQDDSSEFCKIIDPKTTTIFDKNDFRKYYGKNYLETLTTFSKVYFLNMLLKENLIDDSFYFTDDDVLFFNDSFEKVVESEKAIYAKDMFLKIHEYYNEWPKIKNWINENYRDDYTLSACATNFYFPKNTIPELRKHFTKHFDECISILYDDREYIQKLNEKSKSTRNASAQVFYIDTPFLNIVFPKIGLENYTLSQIYLSFYSHLRGIKEKLNTIKTHDIIEKYFSKMKEYPARQPLVHFSVTNKFPLMRDCYNYFNGQNYVHENIDDILKENPREKKKLLKPKVKKLF
jgi:hypothetical protein